MKFINPLSYVLIVIISFTRDGTRADIQQIQSLYIRIIPSIRDIREDKAIITIIKATGISMITERIISEAIVIRAAA